MNSQDDDNLAIVGVILSGIIGLVIAGAVGLAIQKSRSKPAAEKPDAVLSLVTSLVLGNPANAAAAEAAAVSADAPSVKVEDGVVKFYFASGKADLAVGANAALADVVKALAGGKKALVSGFHDASGDPAKNAELAKQRALAVQAALTALGAAEGSVQLKKPEQTSAGGAPAQGRRVEVAVQ
ncbi:MAG: OmpA family protein [Burkholderiaceae bacterium]